MLFMGPGELQLAATASMAGEEGPNGQPLTQAEVQQKLRSMQEVGPDHKSSRACSWAWSWYDACKGE